jgi:hypothetical protein
MSVGRDIWAAALRGGQGKIPGLDFVELPRDSIQRDAIIVIAAECHVAAAGHDHRQYPSFHARLNLVSRLVRASSELQASLVRPPWSFVLFGTYRMSCVDKLDPEQDDPQHDIFPRTLEAKPARLAVLAALALCEEDETFVT